MPDGGAGSGPIERAVVAANRWAVIALLAAMTVIIFVNVALRYVFGTSLAWAEEAARHLMIWLTFVGGGLALRDGAHIAIESLHDALSPRARFALRVAIVVALFALCAALAWAGIDYAWRTRFQMSAALQLPMPWIYAGMPVGCVLLAVHLGFIARRYVAHGASGQAVNAVAAL